MRKLSIPFIFLIVLIMSSCSKTNEPEVYSIRFNQQDYTVMAFVTNSISYVDGGGSYEIEIGNPSIIDKAGIDIETRRLIITPKSIGNSTITIKDIKADAAVTLNITVVDFYLSFIVTEITGHNINPYIDKDSQIRFIRTIDNNRNLEICTFDNVSNKKKLLAEGHFDIMKGDNEFTLDMVLHNGDQYKLEFFSYSVKGDDRLFDIFNQYFDYNWEKRIKSKVLPIQPIKMDLIDVQNDCTISTSLMSYNPNIN